MIDDPLYRRKSTNKPKLTEDSDHYGYTDTNGGPIMDTDISPPILGAISNVGIYRKRKKSKARIVRKSIKKCKCKKK